MWHFEVSSRTRLATQSADDGHGDEDEGSFGDVDQDDGDEDDDDGGNQHDHNHGHEHQIAMVRELEMLLVREIPRYWHGGCLKVSLMFGCVVAAAMRI